jgi:hypothetical protein
VCGAGLLDRFPYLGPPHDASGTGEDG